MNKEGIKAKINERLKAKETSIRNKNAFEQLFSLVGPLDALYGVLFGAKDKIEIERQMLTLDEVLDLVISIDNRLEGRAEGTQNPKITILLEDVFAKGNVTGFEGNTSDPAVKEIFKNNPMDVKLKNIAAEGDVTGVKLNVDDRAELKQPLNIQNDSGSVKFNPGEGRRIIFGATDDDVS